MSAVISVCACVCITAIGGSIISIIIPDGNMKKIISLVLGVFFLCSLIVPVRNAVNGFSADLSQSADVDEITATADEVYTQSILDETSAVLSKTLEGYLKSENIPFIRTKFYLCRDDNLGIIINKICIYIKKTDNTYVFRIKEITEENFGQTPFVIAEK